MKPGSIRETLTLILLYNIRTGESYLAATQGLQYLKLQCNALYIRVIPYQRGLFLPLGLQIFVSILGDEQGFP